MAITKIHPIKSTLNLAMEYIVNGEKTDEKILVSSFKCHPSTAHIQFGKTRFDNQTKGSVLARHLIQSFLPGEVSPEKAHEIGLELCKRILKEEYEYVLTTHIDKGHIHNHIIFNNVNMVTGKCYQSNKRSYHQIRYQSDNLCKEYKLSVIDEYYEAYKKKYKTKGKSWYENEQAKKGNSWKSKLQFDIDKLIKQAKDWDEFLRKMQELGYEIKYGKHIAFKHKDKERFTRAKTIGEDYTEEKLKERIINNQNKREYTVKKRIGNIIDIKNNEKIKSNKAYERWATKHNIKTASEMIVLMREQGFKSFKYLDKFIKESTSKRQSIQDEIKLIEKEIEGLSSTMENIHNVNKYRQIYQAYKKDKSDKSFFNEHKSEIILYEKALADLKKSYSKMPSSKDIFEELESLNEKKNTLMQEYSSSNDYMNELYQIRKNYEKYMGKEMER